MTIEKMTSADTILTNTVSTIVSFAIIRSPVSSEILSNACSSVPDISAVSIVACSSGVNTLTRRNASGIVACCSIAVAAFNNSSLRSVIADRFSRSANHDLDAMFADRIDQGQDSKESVQRDFTLKRSYERQRQPQLVKEVSNRGQAARSQPSPPAAASQTIHPAGPKRLRQPTPASGAR